MIPDSPRRWKRAKGRWGAVFGLSVPIKVSARRPPFPPSTLLSTTPTTPHSTHKAPRLPPSTPILSVSPNPPRNRYTRAPSCSNPLLSFVFYPLTKHHVVRLTSPQLPTASQETDPLYTVASLVTSTTWSRRTASTSSALSSMSRCPSRATPHPFVLQPRANTPPRPLSPRVPRIRLGRSRRRR